MGKRRVDLPHLKSTTCAGTTMQNSMYYVILVLQMLKTLILSDQLLACSELPEHMCDFFTLQMQLKVDIPVFKLLHVLQDEFAVGF